jgi:thiol-disulfide isomerase/thioredoxin
MEETTPSPRALPSGIRAKLQALPSWKLGILVPLVAFAAYGLGRHFAPPPEARSTKNLLPDPGRLAPDLRGVDLLTGDSVSVAQDSGKVRVVFFWATWCPFCLQEFPILSNLRQELGPIGLSILAVSLDDLPRDQLSARVSALSPAFPVVRMDRPPEGYRGGRGLPTAFLIGRDGRFLARIEGAKPEAQWRRLIEPALE